MRQIHYRTDPFASECKCRRYAPGHQQGNGIGHVDLFPCLLAQILDQRGNHQAYKDQDDDHPDPAKPHSISVHHLDVLSRDATCRPVTTPHDPCGFKLPAGRGSIG